MIFLFNYLKLIAWSTIYYLNDYKSPILTKILIKNIREAGCVPIKFCQWVLPQLEVVYDIEIGDFFVFGANQLHSVNPYQCEEGDPERRSVSFNAIFKSKTLFEQQKKEYLEGKHEH